MSECDALLRKIIAAIDAERSNDPDEWDYDMALLKAEAIVEIHLAPAASTPEEQ